VKKVVMDRPIVWLPTLTVLGLLALVSLAWGAEHALQKSDDLLRRAQEVGLFLERQDPYRDPDSTYPPSALPLFAALIGPVVPAALRGFWLALNLAALLALCVAVMRLWGRDWPAWLQLGFCLVVAASKPVRGGIGLGQFHLIPMALIVFSVWSVRAKREWTGGLLLGLALAKPTMALPFLGFLAARQHWRALAAACAVQIAAFLAVAAWLHKSPVHLVREWLARAQGQEAAGLVDVPSLLHRAWPEATVSVSLVTLVLLALTVAATIALRHRSELALVSFCAFSSAVMAYHRPYDLVLLVPALALAIEGALRAPVAWVWPRSMAAAAFALALVLPNDPLVRSGYEHLYEVAFTVSLYAFLAIVVWDLVRGGPVQAVQGTSGPGRGSAPALTGPWFRVALPRSSDKPANG
jgi:hypothetical protein